MANIDAWIGSDLKEIPSEIYDHVEMYNLYHLFKIDPKWAVKTGNLELIKAVSWNNIEYRERNFLLDIAAEKGDIPVMNWLYDNNISTSLSYLAIVTAIQKKQTAVWNWYFHKDPSMFNWIHIPIQLD